MHRECHTYYQNLTNNLTNIPKNYRPITCLSIMYKILTSIVSEKTYPFLDANNIPPSEQKRCKKGFNGCRGQLLINKMLLENSRFSHRNYSTAWVDYRKPFNSAPHTWILKVLPMHKRSLFIIDFLTTSIKKWKTNLYLNKVELFVKSSRLSVNVSG